MNHPVWPPPGVKLPVFDEGDARTFGWDIGYVGADAGPLAGCYVLQAGRCGDHFSLALLPGARIIHHEDGRVEIHGVIFNGRETRHTADCPTGQ